MRARRISSLLVPLLVVAAALAWTAPGAGAAPVVVPLTCSAVGEMTPRGSVTFGTPPLGATVPLDTLGQPVADALADAELPVPVPVDLTATAEVEPGGVVDYAGSVQIDVGDEVVATAEALRDAIAVSYPELADTFTARVALEAMTVELPYPDGTTGTGVPTATGTGVTAGHGTGGLLVEVDEVSFDTETGGEPVDVELAWSVLDGGTAAPAVLDQHLGAVAFVLDVEIGGTVPDEFVEPLVPEAFRPFVPDQVPLVVGARGDWACTQGDPPTVLASTSVVAPPAACTTGFVDVGPDHRFCADVAWAVDAGLVQGWPDGTFRPTVAVSRQALAAILHRLEGSPAVPPGAPTFPDVPPGHRFEDEIRWLAAEGISGGYDDGTFRPTAPISRQAMASMLHRLADEPAPPDDAPTFPDVPPGHRFEVPIRWLAAEGITTGYDDGTFRPGVPVSRQAAVAMLRRAEA